ncbi:MAG: hypothetical protein IPH44_41085 [Myxococcales bacterium]|nr:hypothetical protein [Myxococcales bacterium]
MSAKRDRPYQRRSNIEASVARPMWRPQRAGAAEWRATVRHLVAASEGGKVRA